MQSSETCLQMHAVVWGHGEETDYKQALRAGAVSHVAENAQTWRPHAVSKAASLPLHHLPPACPLSCRNHGYLSGGSMERGV